MKLNPDCIRDILLSVEEATDGARTFRYGKEDNKHPHLAKYSHEEILYHVKQCDMSELIVNCHILTGGKFILIGDLSPKGHEFLAAANNDNVWNRLKVAFEKVGVPTIGTMLQMAASIFEDFVKSKMGLI